MPKTSDETVNADRLLTPKEVADMFRVDPKTATRWAAAGRCKSIRTPGGHHRFPASQFREFDGYFRQLAAGEQV